MKTYEFDVVLRDICEVTDEQADSLFSAGCDDGTRASCNGVTWVHFDREAATLEDAIRTAVAQVRTAGLKIAKVELSVESAVLQGV